jgi:hypothetical protein
MKVRFQLTADDFVESTVPTPSLRRAWKSLRRRNSDAAGTYVALGTFVLALLLMLGAGLYLTVTAHVLWALLLLLPAFLLYRLLLLWGGGARRRARKLFASDPRHADPREVEADARSFRAFASTFQTDIGWPGVVGWTETPNLFLLFDDEHTHVLPKRAFADEVGKEQFRQILQTHIPGGAR